MAGKGDASKVVPLPARPAIISHHSSSVPTTPHQYPRDMTGFRSRSPSPNADLGNHSPRSVSSEANAMLPTLRKTSGGCRYETNMAFGRRRIPYNIGSDLLERIEEEKVKVVLEPHEEDKLTGDMRELYDRLLPSEESVERRKKLVTKLEAILRAEWPNNSFKVHVFGSSGNLLYTNDSDVDICIQTPFKKLETMHVLAEVLAKHGMNRVVCVPSAKVPIVKIWDPELQLASDINVNNTLALENTRMIKTYIHIDERVRPLAMVIKHWTKQRILNDAALGGTLSSYTWICMILNFLQTRNPPILPALHQMAEKDASNVSQPAGFADDLDKLRGFGDANKESLGQLLFQFFRLYGHVIDYEASVVSVRHGRILTRKEKKWDVESLCKEGRDRLCVEEPFNTTRNLGNSADDTAFRGIHMEIRRAFDLLGDGQKLDQCCEQYEYPVEEKPSQPLFKKPVSGPKPVISFGVPHSGRGGRGGGNARGRGGFQAKNGHSFRRASTASYGNGRPPFLPNPPVGISPQDLFARGLENHLFQQYQMLEMQQNHLKAQLLAQSQAQQVQQAQITAHLHAQAQAHAHAQVVAGQGRTVSLTGSPSKTAMANGRSSPRVSESAPASAALLPSYLYPYPIQFEPSMIPSVASDGSRTNPSSPSLTPALPQLRRGVHRSSAASDTPAASIRSQSQPARSVPSQLPPQVYPPLPQYDPAFLAALQLAPTHIPPEAFRPYASAELPQQQFTPTSGIAGADHVYPKEYIGYYVDSPEMGPQGRDFSVPPIPSWNEISQRRRRVSPELPSAALLSSAMRRVSRSPSPLSGGHFRSYSTGLRSAPLPQQPFNRADQRTERVDSVQQRPSPTGASGLLIVNGSYPHTMQDSKDRGTEESTNDAAVSSDDLSNSPPNGPLGSDAYLPQPAMATPPQLYASDLLERHNAVELAGSGLTNETAVPPGAPPLPNGLPIVSSKLTQAFPPYMEDLPVITNGIPSKYDDELSPTSHDQNLSRTGQVLNGIPPLDISQANATSSYQEHSESSSRMLSPVAEARTPSPTASRSMPPISAKPQRQKNALSNKPNGIATRDSHLPPPPKPANAAKAEDHKESSPVEKLSPQSSTSPQAGNGWQKPATRKRPKKKNSVAKAGNEVKPQGGGQPIPVNESERKGG